jgi:N-acetylglutamate synthase-like GNAT family acetyltransferase
MTVVYDQEPSVIIAPMCEEHLEEAHRLNFQLDYVISREIFMHNFRQLSKSTLDSLYVVLVGQAVVGWMHTKVQQRLQDPSALEIVALVVDEQQRGKGIGKLLVKKAEQEAQKAHLQDVILFSDVKRVGAHTFYEKLGFENKKSSKWFTKTVEAQAQP